MGKISKALEKAEKENTTKPVDQRISDRVNAEMEISSPAKKKPARQIKQPQIHNRQRLEVPAVENRKDIGPPKPSVPHPTPDTYGSSGESALESKPPHRLEKWTTKKAAPPKAVLPDPPVDPRSKTEAHKSQKSDGLSITLVKPEVSDFHRQVHGVTREVRIDKSGPDTTVAEKPTTAKKVRVNYSRTKVQINDPQILRNNKIFSVFDDLEATDQIKILRTQVLRKLKAIGGNSILITSANPYEGKTFTSINLGASIAKEFDRTVLIIDADIRKPTQEHTSFSTEFFSLQVEKGLTDYLEGDADISDILINPGLDKLTLIPGGEPVGNSPELLNSGRMEEMMLEIKSRYPTDRVVIVDGPALLPFPDAIILSRYVDGVIPVIEAEKTSSDDLKKMMLRLKEVHVLGTVLNKNRS